VFRFDELEEHAAECTSAGAVLDEHSRPGLDYPSLLDQVLDTLLAEPMSDPFQRGAQPPVGPVLAELVAELANEISVAPVGT
jgi:hypothetical protein